MVDQYVLPHQEGWAVRPSTSRTVTKTFATREEALDFACKLADEQQSAVFLKSLENEVTKHDSFRPTSMQVENHSIMIGNAYQARSDEKPDES